MRVGAAAQSTAALRGTRATGSARSSASESKKHFGWGKTVGRIRQTVYRGIRRVDQHFKLTMVASNLTRMARMPEVRRTERRDEPPRREDCVPQGPDA